MKTYTDEELIEMGPNRDFEELIDYMEAKSKLYNDHPDLNPFNIFIRSLKSEDFVENTEK